MPAALPPRGVPCRQVRRVQRTSAWRQQFCIERSFVPPRSTRRKRGMFSEPLPRVQYINTLRSYAGMLEAVMTLPQARACVPVAELGSVSKAAVRLRIAQPALSRQIIDLEQELGLGVFDRVGRRLLLTGEGEQLIAG